MTPQSIDTAPRDGTVILTDTGFARYVDHLVWGSPVRNGWVNCDPFGGIYACADEGWYYSSPKLWVPVPEWISG
jgi:hypothetical protein